MRGSIAWVYRALRRLCAAVLLTGAVSAGDAWVPPELAGVKTAFADDDDGGDDDGGGRSSAGNAGRGSAGPRRATGGNLLRGLQRLFPRASNRGSRRAAAPAPLPVRADNEIVAIGLTVEQSDQLVAAGFVTLQREALASLGTDIVKLRIPPGTTLEAARDALRAAAPGAIADFNHYFRPGEEISACEGRHCAAPALVGWPLHLAGQPACGERDATLGLIDTAINVEHAAFERGQIEVIRLAASELPESGRQHGTAVAALLVGSADSASPGLLPSTRLIAVDAFHRGGRRDDRAEAYDLVRAIDLLAARKVDVVNMSLSGPANELLARVVAETAKNDIVLVAAAGNHGPKAPPAYPAAYPETLAVTAVDRRKRPYRRAVQGDHIDLAAPGVEIWTAASVRGSRPKTGTSFAAPFVTAAAALAKLSGKTTSREIHDVLTASAEDLGDPGRDRVFGWGLLDARALCGPG